ncbi:MAG: hypothetical protein ABFS34_14210 [Gemmatimonadota bacterium]
MTKDGGSKNVGTTTELEHHIDLDLHEQVEAQAARAAALEEAAPWALGVPIQPLPLPPWLLQASGLYEWKWSLRPIPLPLPLPVRPPSPGGAEAEEEAIEPEITAAESVTEALETSAAAPWFRREELRLDVDGRYPLLKASGTITSGLATRVHWIADLRAIGANTYAGSIWYKNGDTAWLPHSGLTIQVTKSWFPGNRRVVVRFTGRGVPTRVRQYRWLSPYAHPVDFEYDCVAGTTAVTNINTGDHPNRPPGLPAENLTIDTVFRRAGLQVTSSTGGLPIGGAGPNARWSDMEMHDAMQIYWSRFADQPQWAMWVLFAALHDAGTGLGGIMFDDIGPNHRQGTAIFNDSFINNAPGTDPNGAAWVRRMKFWTACHEMGHAFNLAHSWQKALGTPWIPLANEPEARSFMNYPYYVSGGQASFFADFEFRFSPSELLFMRHAPARFVQMGNADWFDHHGFEQANVLPGSAYGLEIRVHRSLDYFEFMEPVVVELKLTNTSTQPLIVEEAILERPDALTVVIRKRGEPARLWRPLAQYCHHGEQKVLVPGESLYAPLRIGTGVGGWEIDEPGMYDVQASLRIGEEDVVSNALRVRVAPPRSYEEQFLAQDFFTEDVGRVLAFHGSRHLEKANDTLREVADQLDERRVAVHARLALANPLMRDYKLLQVEGETEGFREARAAGALDVVKQFQVIGAKPDEAEQALSRTLIDEPEIAADTLGHIDYRQAVEQFTEFLAEEGNPMAAVETLETAKETLSDRNVLPSVVQEMDARQKAYAKAGKSRTKSSNRAKKAKK